jgi:hypothetical protein
MKRMRSNHLAQMQNMPATSEPGFQLERNQGEQRLAVGSAGSWGENLRTSYFRIYDIGSGKNKTFAGRVLMQFDAGSLELSL